MHIFSKKFNATRSAFRQTAKTGVQHLVESVTGGFAVVPQNGWHQVDTSVLADAAVVDPAIQGIACAAPVTITLPSPPDFSAPTHKGYRAKLAQLVAMAEAHDTDGLAGFAIVPASSSRKALARYRDSALASLTPGRAS